MRMLSGIARLPSLFVVAGCAALAGACATTAPTTHGTISTLSQTKSARVELCDHRVPSDTCVRHNPQLVPRFKEIGDWCVEHDIPESQCLLCHPDLSFEPLPELPPEADVKWLSKAGEDVPDLWAQAAPGRITIFDFYADWCAPCRKVDEHVFRMLQTRRDVALRKVNVTSWESAVAKKHLGEVSKIPYVVVIAPDGRRVGAVVDLDIAALDRLVDEAGKGAAR